MDLVGPPSLPDIPEHRCCAYYDVMNFAPEVACPVLMNAGLVDPVSWASCVYAVYLRLGTTQKRMVPLPGLGHDWSAEFDRQAWRWLERVLHGRRGGSHSDGRRLDA
jgi:cephalosporin-C deacetylase-like acetyl esterase